MKSSTNRSCFFFANNWNRRFLILMAFSIYISRDFCQKADVKIPSIILYYKGPPRTTLEWYENHNFTKPASIANARSNVNLESLLFSTPVYWLLTMIPLSPSSKIGLFLISCQQVIPSPSTFDFLQLQILCGSIWCSLRFLTVFKGQNAKKGVFNVSDASKKLKPSIKPKILSKVCYVCIRSFVLI